MYQVNRKAQDQSISKIVVYILAILLGMAFLYFIYTLRGKLMP